MSSVIGRRTCSGQRRAPSSVEPEGAGDAAHVSGPLGRRKAQDAAASALQVAARRAAGRRSDATRVGGVAQRDADGLEGNRETRGQCLRA